MRRRASRAVQGTAAAVVVGGLALTPFGVGTARAEVNGSYEGFASANGFALVISNPSIPTGIDIEGGGPQAQAKQTSLGIGDASAQLPYAGETVPGLPGTGAALLGLPGPPYPFIASTNRGSAPVTVSYPGLTLRASSGPFATVAESTLGTDASGATSVARVEEQDDGSVASTSETKANTLSFGPSFTLSNLRTLASVVADGATGELRRTTSTSIGRIYAPGLVLRIPEQTPGTIPEAPFFPPGVPQPAPPPLPILPIPSGGQTLLAPDIGFVDGYFTVTLPSDGLPGAQAGSNRYLLPAEPVIGAFKAAGVAMTFQAPQELGDGVLAGAVTFDFTIPAPPQNPGVNGATRVRQSTGAALATATLRPIAAAPATADVAAGGVAGGLDGAGGPSGVLDAAGLPAPSPDGPLPVAGSMPATVDLVPSAAAGTGGTSISFAGFSTSSINALYLVVAVVALGGLAAATALRLMGVRLRWMS